MDAPQPPGSGAGGAEPATDVRTFLLVDVRGYTRFTLEQGDEAAARLASQFAALVRDVAEARAGELLELRGDEALVVFTSARRALRAAAELQERFTAALLRDPAQWRPVGMGLDAGEAIPVEGGYRGGALNLAGRLVSLAGPGEVLASEAVVHLAGKLAGLTMSSAAWSSSRASPISSASSGSSTSWLRRRRPSNRPLSSYLRRLTPAARPTRNLNCRLAASSERCPMGS